MKKLLSLLIVVAVLASCAATVSFADNDNYLGVMLSTNVMSLDTNLATDGESFEVIADCIDGLMQILSEHMEVIKLLYPKEYQAVLQRIREIP